MVIDRTREINYLSRMQKTTLIPLEFSKAGFSIPAGTTLDLRLERDAIRATYQGRNVRFTYSGARQRFGPTFGKAPSLATLNKWSNDGIARTPTGERVETDGIGTDGAPSWLVVLGLI